MYHFDLVAVSKFYWAVSFITVRTVHRKVQSTVQKQLYFVSGFKFFFGSKI